MAVFEITWPTGSAMRFEIFRRGTGHHRNIHQAFAYERGRLRITKVDRDIEPVRDEISEPFLNNDLDTQVRMQREERLNRRGQNVLSKNSVGIDPQQTVDGVRRLSCIRRRRFDAGQQRDDGLVEASALVGQRDRPGCPVEQAYPDPLLQPGNRPADGRLREPHGLRRAEKISGPHDSGEDADPTEETAIERHRVHTFRHGRPKANSF